MVHLFYLFGILFVMNQIDWILNTKKKTERCRKFRKFLNSKDNPSDTQTYVQLFFHFFVLIWLFSGLLTFQWFAFLLFLVVNILVTTPIIGRFAQKENEYILHFINSLIGLAFGLFVVINHYHLRIDLYSLVLGLFK